ncbi:hypothetical protein Asp14428_48680 [Actinoplanes sp. NBRC 14428]|nr:hypothetical protein Asp14428_48680 [Actinoplanes sp. NBRC 14428]
MQARSLKDLVQIPAGERPGVIAEGLQALVEHVTELTSEVETVAAAACTRAVPTLQMQSEEESAKVLILLDLVRASCDDAAVSTHAGFFYGHLSRCIYARMAEMRPANFAEVRTLVDSMRASLYLDGPSSVDWICRNELIDSRERSLYVDFVRHEDGMHWTSPADPQSKGWGVYIHVQKLVMSMDRLGMTNAKALEIISQHWKNQHLDDATHWQVVAQINRKIVEALLDAGLTDQNVTSDDTRRVIEHWTFPLSTLDLRERKVTMEELEEQRNRRLAELS